MGKKIQANRPVRAKTKGRSELELTCSVAFPDVAATADGESPSDPTFEMVAYTGGPMKIAGWKHPLVVDIEGLDVSQKSRPVFKDHYSGDIVGHTTAIDKVDGQLHAKGVVSGANEVADAIVASAKKGFPWQASIGANAVDAVFIAAGKSVSANGRTFSGPVYLVRKSRLSEISFVALGADDNTSSRVAARGANNTEVEMGEFEKWLAARGWNAEDLTDDQQKVLRATFDAEVAAAASDESDDVQTPDLVTAAAEQASYVASIEAACEGDAEVLASALKGRWTVEQTKLALENKRLKAQRPAPINGSFAIHSHESDASDAVLEAAVSLAIGITPEELRDPLVNASADLRRDLRRSSERPLDEKTIDAAERQFRNIGMRDLCHIVARRDARYTGMYGDVDGVIRASFTTLSLPTVFQQALNRALLAQYTMSAFNWRSVAKATSVPDFRQQTRFRVHGTGHWERLTPDGELKHGQIEEGDQYTIKAETIGQMLMLTRQDFINDDLGALNRIASQMTFYGSLAPELEVFKAIIANAGSFFHANNDNLITGGSTAFGLDGLTQLWTKFRKRRDRGVTKDKVQPAIDITPRILLVPVELELDAQLLLGQAKLEVGGSNADTGLVTTNNPFYNKFRIVSSIYLSDTNLHASASATAYYLLAEPSLLPAVEICFLNGKQRPTVESVEARPEVLGMGFRGWHDFGVKLMDPKAAAKSAGA